MPLRGLKSKEYQAAHHVQHKRGDAKNFSHSHLTGVMITPPLAPAPAPCPSCLPNLPITPAPPSHARSAFVLVLSLAVTQA